MRSHHAGHPAAFSLIELLVVIGIIALLIAILMPALSNSRESANRVQCLNTLRTIAQGAQLHANDHRGYFPLAGWQWDPVGGLTDPKGVNDPEARRYDYYTDDGVQRPLPVTAALGLSLGVSVRTDSRAHLEEDLIIPRSSAILPVHRRPRRCRVSASATAPSLGTRRANSPVTCSMKRCWASAISSPNAPIP